MNVSLMKLVKYQFENTNGVSFTDFMLVPIEAGMERGKPPSTIGSLPGYASLGKPYLRNFVLLEEEPLPEDMRRTGIASVAKARVILYDRNPRDYDAKTFMARMRDILEKEEQ